MGQLIVHIIHLGGTVDHQTPRYHFCDIFTNVKGYLVFIGIHNQSLHLEWGVHTFITTDHLVPIFQMSNLLLNFLFLAELCNSFAI